MNCPEQLFIQTRKEVGLSQNQLANMAGYDHSYVSRIESATRTPSREALENFIEAMGGFRYYELMDAYGYVTDRHVLVPAKVDVRLVTNLIANYV